jgi:general secretion pathway protein F
MVRFFYKAKESPHKLIDGFIQAENVEGAIVKVVGLGYVPVDISRVRDHESARSTRVTHLERMLFTRQLADLMLSGIPVHRSLQVIARQTRNPYFRGIQEDIAEAVRSGDVLSAGLDRFPGIFSPLYVNMVRSGEISGQLGRVLERLADFQERDLETLKRLQSSLIYPSMVFFAGIMTVFVLFSFVIPRMAVLFEDFGAALPLSTRILLAIGDCASKTWWAVPVLPAIAIYILRSQKILNKTFLWDVSGKIPFLGEYLRDTQTARFLRTLAVLLQSGVMIIPALRSAAALLEEDGLKKKMDRVIDSVLKGMSLKKALEEERCFPPAVLSMIAVGEESGQLARNLSRAADSCERRLMHMNKNFISLLEPLLIIVIGAVVAFIAMAMLLPIFQLDLIVE